MTPPRAGRARGGTAPPVSVIICACDRPDRVERAVRAVLASDHVTIDLIVLDQGDGQETKQRLATLADHRVRYVRGTYDGRSFGLNEGLLLARSPIVVIIDDDCDIPPDWVAGMTQLLVRSPRVALAFSKFLPAIGATCRQGRGAGTALRRDVVVAVGGFSDATGPGAGCKPGDDWDLQARLLLKGWDVSIPAAPSMPHQGVGRAADLPRPRGLGRIRAFCHGLVQGMRIPSGLPRSIR